VTPLEHVVRFELNGQYAEALSQVQALRQDPETDLALVHALLPYEMHLERLVPAPTLGQIVGGWIGRRKVKA